MWGLIFFAEGPGIEPSKLGTIQTKDFVPRHVSTSTSFPFQRVNIISKMSDDDNLSIYDEIEIEDMTFDEAQQLYHYPCPCGDRFQIAIDDLRDEQDIAVCPSCSLMIRVIFDLVS